MVFLKRDIANTLKRFSKFPVIGIFGPRQSGKTTIVKNTFKKHIYLNFEDPDIRDFAINDPRGFLSQNENEYGIILDEFQYVPQILSYIQLESDEKKRPGYFVLTGSQNFLMNQAITQSLAGRIGILNLLPLSINELKENQLLNSSPNEIIVSGGYPRIYTENFTNEEFYPSYIHSYVERDVRLLINIENLRTFRKFMQLCAARVGQLLNISDLAMSCGINQRTAENWLSILEASYIIFLLMPHHKNYNKRVIKTPKLYFFDTGLVCSLLGIKNYEDFGINIFKGNIFECFIISDFYKQYYNVGSQPALYFWRDKNGYTEIDCIVDKAGNLTAIEIKSGETVISGFWDSLNKWNEISGNDKSKGFLIYGGNLTQSRQNGNLVSWFNSANLIEKIYKLKSL